MTTKFASHDECMTTIAGMMNKPVEEVIDAYAETAELTTIGFPQHQEATIFKVGDYKLAISDFRDGKAIWSVTEEGFMVRW